MKTIAIAGTFDSKGPEFLYLKELIEGQGIRTLTIHTGVFEPIFTPDVSNGEVAAAAGEDICKVAEKKDRAWATEVLTKGMEILVPKLYQEGKFDGIISMGGSGGTAMVTAAMRALPVGVPKVMVSTMAGGDVSRYVGTSDIVMMPSIVDVAGINTISSKIYANAAFAICGMVSMESTKEVDTRPLIAATMFGVTTPCIMQAQSYLESKGYEVVIFHAVGTGGQSMEALIKAGFFKGVLDITTTEWCDEVVGGILNAGPHRNEAAALCGVPQVVSVGACDMVNFAEYDTVPEKFAGRNLYKHNPQVTLMRTTVEENREIGKRLAEKLNMATGETTVILPLKGVSMIDAEGEAFYGPEEDKVLFDTLREGVRNEKVTILEMDAHVNDEAFSIAACDELLALIEKQQ